MKNKRRLDTTQFLITKFQKREHGKKGNESQLFRSSSNIYAIFVLKIKGKNNKLKKRAIYFTNLIRFFAFCFSLY